MPGARCTRSLGPKEKRHRAKSPRSHRKSPGIPAQWFYGVLRDLPGDQACLTPSPALLLADLTPASGRQNHTTWPYANSAVVFGTARVHRIPPRVDDVGQRPSVGRDNDGYRSDLGQASSEVSEIRKF